MKYLLLLLPFVVLTACGDEEEVEKGREPVELKTEKDKLSYSIGSKQAWDIVNSKDPNVQKFDLEEIAKGFKAGFGPGFDASPSNPCMATLQNLFGGGNGSVFDETYLKEGCNCMGKLTAGMMYQELDNLGQLDRLDKDLVIRGFEDGLVKADTVLTQEEKTEILTAFDMEMRQIAMQKHQEKMAAFDKKWEQIKAIPGIKELENGIYLETIKAGTGGRPALGNDIEASYILSDFDGNLLQNSKDVTPEGKFQTNLKEGPGGVIKGWVIGFQSISKGGRYKLYIPAEMAYGDRPLQFEVELFNYGPEGSLVK